MKFTQKLIFSWCLKKWSNSKSFHISATFPSTIVQSEFINSCKEPSRECILRICDECDKVENIAKVVREQALHALPASFSSSSEPVPEEVSDFFQERIEFKQWKSTDRAELATEICSRSELITNAAKQIHRLISHDFVAREQSLYLKKAKSSLDTTKVIAIMDFSMNYSCVVQDAVQSYHWSRKEVTLHPVVVYHYNAEIDAVDHFTLCFVSDDLVHDVPMVTVIEKKMSAFVTDRLPSVEEIEYMTDGCAAQYKKKGIFLNLCRHKYRFGLKARHSFFATSHGKSTSDAAGGTIKRTVTDHCMRHPLEGQILNAQQLFEFCKQHLSKKIHFEFVEKQEVDDERHEYKPQDIITVPGTRSFHFFIPLSSKEILFQTRCKACVTLMLILHLPFQTIRWAANSLVRMRTSR